MITGNLEIVKHLVDNNAEVLVQDEITYPIDYAIDEGDKAMIKYFLSIQKLMNRAWKELMI